ncbi:MAG: TldD/PmbA family protein [Bacillota bacterium]
MSQTEFEAATAGLRDLLPSLIADLEQAYPYAAAVVTDTAGLEVSVDTRKQTVNFRQPMRGTVFTVFDGRTVHELATSSWDPGELTRLAARLKGRALGLRPPLIEAGQPESGHHVGAALRPAESVPLDEKVAFCASTRAALAALDQRIVNAMVAYTEGTERKLFVNRSKVVSDEVTRVSARSIAFASDGGQARYYMTRAGGTGGFELAAFTPEELERVVKVAVDLLGAGKVDPGTYPVVVHPEVGGIIAHEAFGHGVELDMFLKGRARAQEYLGRQVAADLVSLVDDPSLPGAYGSYAFDDEGQRSAPTPILTRGVFLEGLSDFATSAALRAKRTANGRRQDFRRKAYPRMSNTFFVPGQTPVGALFEGIKDGFYLESGLSGMEDPKDWGIQVIAYHGRRIRNGKLTGDYITNVGITGFVPDLLMSIDAVANDFGLHPGGCGKGHKEFVPVSTGGPHLRMKARLG